MEDNHSSLLSSLFKLPNKPVARWAVNNAKTDTDKGFGIFFAREAITSPFEFWTTTHYTYTGFIKLLKNDSIKISLKMWAKHLGSFNNLIQMNHTQMNTFAWTMHNIQYCILFMQMCTHDIHIYLFDNVKCTLSFV